MLNIATGIYGCCSLFNIVLRPFSLITYNYRQQINLVLSAPNILSALFSSSHSYIVFRFSHLFSRVARLQVLTKLIYHVHSPFK